MRRRRGRTRASSITTLPTSSIRSWCASTWCRCRSTRLPRVKRRVAAQSELLALDETHFLLLARDSTNGYGFEPAASLYRKIGILDTSNATNIAGSKYDGIVPVAPKGKLEDGIVPATLTAFIDINDNSQLNKFGLRNGEPNDRNTLREMGRNGPDRSRSIRRTRRISFCSFPTTTTSLPRTASRWVPPTRTGAVPTSTPSFLVYRLTLPLAAK